MQVQRHSGNILNLVQKVPLRINTIRNTADGVIFLPRGCSSITKHNSSKTTFTMLGSTLGAYGFGIEFMIMVVQITQ